MYTNSGPMGLVGQVLVSLVAEKQTCQDMPAHMHTLAKTLKHP